MEKGKNFLLLGENKQVMSSYEPIFVFENNKIKINEKVLEVVFNSEG